MNNSPAKYDVSDLIEVDRAHVWHHLSPHKGMMEKSQDPLIIVKGEGLRVTDIKGKEYLDAVSGALWTVNLGYGRESIANAVRDQLIEMCYFAGAAGSVPGAEYAKKLISKMPGMSRVYYSNSGSEANEKGYKIVRQIAAKENAGKKHKILFRDRDYHGTTITALSSCGHSERKEQYGPFTPGFVEVPHCSKYRAEFGDDSDYGVKAAREIEKIVLREDPDTVGSIILEPITAGGGVIAPPEGYFETVQDICRKYGILLHMDEVVCGIGRTGKWFGYQHYGIKPDIVTMAKGVASGYAAVACTVTTEEVFRKFSDSDDPMSYFRDVSTFGGCTSGPAAALETMRIIEEENILDNVNQMSKYLLDKLHVLQEKHAVIGDVRGVGLFCGLELVVDRASKTPLPEGALSKITVDCMEQGVIIGRTNRSLPGFNNTICLSPALVCTKSDLDEIVHALDNALAQLDIA